MATFRTLDPSNTHSQERLQEIVNYLNSDNHLNEQQLPGLAQLLHEDADPNLVTPPSEEWIRRFIRVFHKSTTEGSYTAIKERYSKDEQDLLDRFVIHGEAASEVGKTFSIGPSLGAREELSAISPQTRGVAFQTIRGLFDHSHGLPEPFHIYNDESQTERVEVVYDEVFQNWGRTVNNKPKITCVPTTSYGVQQTVKYAKSHNMNVRAAGYRHSWAPIFGTEGQILISMVNLHSVNNLPNFLSVPGSEYFERSTDLTSIEMIGTPEPGKTRYVRVGTGVTNQQFRRWCIAQKGDYATTIPFNVILVEVTLGGTTSTICHGAGRDHRTLSDLVHEIEYVDVNGDIQILNKDKDPQAMRAAAGCFGLLGIVTHLTLEIDPMSYAVMTPTKLHVTEAIPLPPEMTEADLPPALRPAQPITPTQRAANQAAFEQFARNAFYAEWFWFPYTSKVWVNCWNTTTDLTNKITDWPTSPDVFVQFAGTVFTQLLQTSEAILSLQETFPYAQALFLSKAALAVLPETHGDEAQAIRTPLPNALHFRRAIQNVRVRDMEIEIPLTPKHGNLADAKFDDEIDFTNVQRAWWRAILNAYKPEHIATGPQRMPLEMRITGPSNIILAPSNGSPLGSCAIEILTLENIDTKLWAKYAQEVLSQWFDLKDNQGKYLDIRMHWAKEGDSLDLKIRGQPLRQYLKQSYAKQTAEFRGVIAQIAKKQGWSLDEAKRRFGNQMLSEIILDDSTSMSTPKATQEGVQKPHHGIIERIEEVLGIGSG